MVAKKNFCAHFKDLVHLSDTCKSCDVTHVMDVDYSRLFNLRVLKPSAQPTLSINCQFFVCYAANPLQNLSSVYSHVDLRQSNLVTAAKD